MPRLYPTIRPGARYAFLGHAAYWTMGALRYPFEKVAQCSDNKQLLLAAAGGDALAGRLQERAVHVYRMVYPQDSLDIKDP